MKKSQSLISPPSRTTYLGSVLIIVCVIAFTLIVFVPLHWAVAAEALLILVGIYGAVRKMVPVVHLALLLALTSALMGIPFFGRLWPLPLILALSSYAAIVLRVQWLRGTIGWLRRGRLGVGEVQLAIIFIILSCAALVLWFVIFEPNVADLRARIPNWSLPMLMLLGLTFALFNALAEEFIYRGVMMESLEAAFGPGVTVVVIQALAFGLLHIHGFPRGWFGVLMATIYGLMLGVIRRRARGIFAPWLTHVFADLTIFGALLFLSS